MDTTTSSSSSAESSSNTKLSYNPLPDLLSFPSFDEDSIWDFSIVDDIPKPSIDKPKADDTQNSPPITDEIINALSSTDSDEQPPLCFPTPDVSYESLQICLTDTKKSIQVINDLLASNSSVSTTTGAKDLLFQAKLQYQNEVDRLTKAIVACRNRDAFIFPQSKSSHRRASNRVAFATYCSSQQLHDDGTIYRVEEPCIFDDSDDVVSTQPGGGGDGNSDATSAESDELKRSKKGLDRGMIIKGWECRSCHAVNSIDSEICSCSVSRHIQMHQLHQPMRQSSTFSHFFDRSSSFKQLSGFSHSASLKHIGGYARASPAASKQLGSIGVRPELITMKSSSFKDSSGQSSRPDLSNMKSSSFKDLMSSIRPELKPMRSTSFKELMSNSRQAELAKEQTETSNEGSQPTRWKRFQSWLYGGDK